MHVWNGLLMGVLHTRAFFVHITIITLCTQWSALDMHKGSIKHLIKRSEQGLVSLLQASQQDLAFAEAASQRFAAGSALNPARTTAEEQYADAMLDIGRTFNDTDALTIAAESYMNLSPWDYYAKVSEHSSLPACRNLTKHNHVTFYSTWLQSQCRQSSAA